MCEDVRKRWSVWMGEVGGGVCGYGGGVCGYGGGRGVWVCVRGRRSVWVYRMGI